MKLKILLVAIAVSLIVFGCAQQSSTKSVAQSAQPAPAKATAQQASSSPNEATVNIYDSGFKPEEVTIFVGGKVTWTNMGSKDHTVSGPNFPMPTSTSPKTSGRLQPGESWTKEFDESGYYGYADVYNDNLKGKVIVK